ncbi:unnamed protein product [Larinioides sclopetarius]|uniref:Uncharacterized protein n=1 Tax=Larinioides sclopetarius TaxID=280406 RepID=A0AAV1Z8F9_9ARAC
MAGVASRLVVTKARSLQASHSHPNPDPYNLDKVYAISLDIDRQREQTSVPVTFRRTGIASIQQCFIGKYAAS